MQVSQDRIDEVLELYDPAYRYLQSVSLEGERAVGNFKLAGTNYTSVPLTHMTAIEAQFCLNQLSYTSFGEWIDQGRYHVQMSRNEYLELMKENMFITDSHIRFRKSISTDTDVSGQIKVRSWKKRGNLYVANVDFEFEDGNADGSLQLVLKQ